MGLLDARLVVLVWTPRGEVRRIISMGKASDREKAFYTATGIDPDDAPELTEAFFQTADRYDGATPKPRGRPKAQTTKEAVKLRLDADVLVALRASGDGWQTRINDALRASLALAGKLA